jgi:hypothetical protein
MFNDGLQGGGGPVGASGAGSGPPGTRMTAFVRYLPLADCCVGERN